MQSATRMHIAKTVRALRKGRGWTQVELAHHLGLSQGRLSQLERGDGSFAAEHLLELLALFNVDIGLFDPVSRINDSLQNALVRFGACHLRADPTVRVDTRHSTAAQVIAEVLMNPESERFVTALCPVLVWSIDDISLPLVQSKLAGAGLPHRLPWLVESTLAASRDFNPGSPRWRRCLRRAELVLGLFAAKVEPPNGQAPLDILDVGVRSRRSMDSTWRTASPEAKRWNVVTALDSADFGHALRRASREEP